MNPSVRWLIFATGIAASILLSLWFGGLFLFLFVPLLFLWPRRRAQ